MFECLRNLGNGDNIIKSKANSELIIDDSDSDVSLHVTTMAGDSVNYDMESDSKISITVQEPLTSIIVQCSAENIAGQGPVQTKIVHIHSKYHQGCILSNKGSSRSSSGTTRWS